MSNINVISPIIYYDESKSLYNFPFILKFTNLEVNIDFYFHEEDYKNQQEMIVDRNKSTSESIVENYIIEQFIALQTICLLEKEKVEYLDVLNKEIGDRLSIIYYLFIIVRGLNNSESILKLKNIREELLEIFILLDDYYIGTKKPELYRHKDKFETLVL